MFELVLHNFLLNSNFFCMQMAIDTDMPKNQLNLSYFLFER